MEKTKQKKMHSFGKTNPNAKCYGKSVIRQPTCGITIEKKFVTNKMEKVTCKRCLKLEGLL
jgi:hypothetical protein